MLPRNIQAYVDFVIEYAKENGFDLTNMKLQKILYYLQAWSLAISDDDLFDDVPQAWMHGPVYTDVYHKYSHLKAAPIVAPVSRPSVARLPISPIAFTSGELVEQERILETILESYMPQTAEWLKNQTHREQPWIEAREGLPPMAPSTKYLSKQTMREYYTTSADMHHPLNPFIPETVAASDINIQKPLSDLKSQWTTMEAYFEGIQEDQVMQKAEDLLLILREFKPTRLVVELTYDHDLYMRAEMPDGHNLHVSITFGEDSDPEDNTFLALFHNKEELWNVSCAFNQLSDTLDTQLNQKELVA
ncbi:DUF4065 domain-containing protein [Hymenobacter sp. NBH84]|uniref:Panacea domain-containing protein n=1 Tax=Hymenobacter sp. NBH84 TaxID=2596915 RepID=UPI00162930B9|nr:type II toxin-antitoxin system antitoxin SocA domain-containing protein [Hymenobacter sp. NBH84]QNE38590.1 DUF4065 domain-containing protein [Hymenobacter sp. NBH84]